MQRDTHIPGDADERLSDLRTIRNLMTRYEEQPLVRPWVFAIWGVLIAVGGTAMGLLADVALPRRLLLVWGPAFLVAGSAELTGWLRQSRQGGQPLFTRRMNRLLASYGGLIVIVAMLVLHMASTGIPYGIAVALAAFPLLAYAQMTFHRLFAEAFALIAAAIVLQVLAPTPTLAWTVVVSVLVGAAFVIAGLHSRRLSERNG